MRALAVLALAAPFLLAAPAGAQSTPQTRLWDASIAGDVAGVNAALDDGAAIDSLDTRRSRNGRRALNWAALNDRVPVVELLIERGATLEARNRTGFTPLHHAAEAGAAGALRALLAAGADPRAANTAGRLPAQTAREVGQIGIALLLETAAGAGR